MYLILKYIVLIILSCRCITIYSLDLASLESNYNYDEFIPAGNHCTILFPTEYNWFMPIPYQRNSSGSAIITPDEDGNLFVAHKELFQFSCPGSTFATPFVCHGLTEVTVECLRGEKITYNGREFDFHAFQCLAMPKAKLTAANASCNGIVNGVFHVGFETKEYLHLYKVCFDARIKRTMYSWNYVNAPLFNSIQISETAPRFVKTEHFKSINMVDVYSPKGQTESKTLEEISMTANRIMIKNFRRFLIPGQLLTRNQFVYSFQQFATYFYENTAPLWSEFSNGVWIDVEIIFLRILSKSSDKHLVVTGTIDSTHLISSKTDVQKPFVLQWPDSIPVPKLIWKMVYNVQNKKGIVFIGLNSPYKTGNAKKYFCKKISCPSRLGKRVSNTNLVYCCTKDSFEKAYGPLDPVLFKEF